MMLRESDWERQQRHIKEDAELRHLLSSFFGGILVGLFGVYLDLRWLVLIAGVVALGALAIGLSILTTRAVRALRNRVTTDPPAGPGKPWPRE